MFNNNVLVRAFNDLKGNKIKISDLYKKQWWNCDCVSKVCDYLFGAGKKRIQRGGFDPDKYTANLFPELDPDDETVQNEPENEKDIPYPYPNANIFYNHGIKESFDAKLHKSQFLLINHSLSKADVIR